VKRKDFSERAADAAQQATEQTIRSSPWIAASVAPLAARFARLLSERYIQFTAPERM
jgi:hypothetical protein